MTAGRLRGVAGACLIALLSFDSRADAHPTPFSYIDLRLSSTALDLIVIAHIFDVGHDINVDPGDRLLDRAVLAERGVAATALMRDRLRLAIDGRAVATCTWSAPDALPERQSLRWSVHCPWNRLPGRLSIDAWLFPYDPQHETFVNVYDADRLTTQFILERRRTAIDYFPGSVAGVIAVMATFVPAGVHHILIGPDHLLFLIGLLLMGGTLRRLVIVITAFTVAHSITLSLAALNLVTPPTRIIEPAIALSIIFVGTDNLVAKGGRDIRGWIALSFGLIHGFGFANVLREMGLPASALGWSLFSFNIGVEIGQLVVVVVVATTLAAIRARSEIAGRRLATAGSVVVILAGTFWFVQRLFFTGGV